MGKLNMIYASSTDDIIGFDNELPWRIKSELEYFKKVTTGNVVVMGGNTFKSLGEKPLPNRINIVLSKGINFNPDVLFINDINTIRDLPMWYKDKDVFIIGGASLYNQLKDDVSSVYKTSIQMTMLDKIPEGKTPIHFKIDLDEFSLRPDSVNEIYDVDSLRGYPVRYISCIFDRRLETVSENCESSQSE